MCQATPQPYGVGVQADRRDELEALQEGVQAILALMEPDCLAWRPAPSGSTAGEIVGLMLLDLDQLSSRPQTGRYPLPGFATEFIHKRLARRLADRYLVSGLEGEFDRRFAAARNVLIGGAGAEGLDPILERLKVRVTDLKAALTSRGVHG
jgi:hypothetical protein